MDALKSLMELVSLKNKKALVTGSAAGIGRAIAYRLAEAGADLVLVDINRGGLETVKAELSRYGSGVEIYEVDLSKKEEIDGLWTKLEKKEPDILVNNAGIYPFKNFLEIDESFFQRMMDINLKATLLMCQQMVRSRQEKGGVIINIGSIEAILPFVANLVPYSVSKAGVIALSRALAREYGREGFRINVIVPGGIMTPGEREASQDAGKPVAGMLRTGMDLQRRLPLGRSGQPDEVARVALFLASDLSSYIHGALIPVDGGFLSA